MSLLLLKLGRIEFVLRLGVEVEGLMILRRVFRFGVCHARVTRRLDVLEVEGFLATELQ